MCKVQKGQQDFVADFREVKLYWCRVRVRQRDAEKEMHYIDRVTHRPLARDLLDGALTKSPVNYHQNHHVSGNTKEWGSIPVLNDIWSEVAKRTSPVQM